MIEMSSTAGDAIDRIVMVVPISERDSLWCLPIRNRLGYRNTECGHLVTHAFQINRYQAFRLLLRSAGCTVYDDACGAATISALHFAISECILSLAMEVTHS